MKAARVSSAELDHAKAVSEKAGLRLVGYEKRPDGPVKLEFGEWSELANDWKAATPLYSVK